jgi:hypothetical protein
MAASLLQLMEELLQSIEQRDAGDAASPAWEASARIQRLEEELARRLSAGEVEPDVSTQVGTQARQPDDALAGVA